MFTKILVAVDGSEPSKKALDYALRLAEKFYGKITLIHVHSRVVPTGPSEGVRWLPTGPSEVDIAMAVKIVEDAKQTGKRILNEAELVVKERGIPVEKVLREGDAVKEIVAVVQEGKFDLVIVGHRGMSKFKELLLGSVSEGVSHRAPCPVLIVK